MASSKPTKDEIERQLLALAEERDAGKTFCPSEVARALSKVWRPLMPQIREVAAKLVTEGKLRCTRKGRDVDPGTARGPIRLGRRTT